MGLFDSKSGGSGGLTTKQAVEELKKRLKETPADVDVVLALADVLAQTGDLREAVLHLSRYGAFFQNRGMQKEAIAVYTKITKLDPQGKVTISYLSKLELKKLLDDAGSVARKEAKEAPPPASSPQVAVKQEPWPFAPAPSSGHVAIMASDEQKKIAERRKKKETLLTLIPGIPLLRDIPLFSFELLLDRVHVRTLAKEAFLFREGDTGASVFFVVAGSLLVTTRWAGAEIELDRLGPGSVAGEIAFLSNIPRTATLQATTDVQLVEFERQAIDQLVRKHRTLGAGLASLQRERVLDAVMARCPLFGGLPRPERDRHAPRMALVEFKAGDRILVEGQNSDCVYILREGEVCVTRIRHAKEEVLGMMPPLEIFGDLALMTKAPIAVTYTAGTECELLCLSAQNFWELLNAHEGIRTRFERRNRVKT